MYGRRKPRGKNMCEGILKRSNQFSIIQMDVKKIVSKLTFIDLSALVLNRESYFNNNIDKDMFHSGPKQG